MQKLISLGIKGLHFKVELYCEYRYSLPTVLSHYLVVGVNQQGLYKVVLY